MPKGLIRGAAVGVLAFAVGLGGAHVLGGGGSTQAAPSAPVGSAAVPLDVVPAGAALAPGDAPALPGLAARPRPEPPPAPEPPPRVRRRPFRPAPEPVYIPPPAPVPVPVPVAPPPPPPAPEPTAPTEPAPDPAPPAGGGPDEAPTFDDSG